jgi:hypothetical protein
VKKILVLSLFLLILNATEHIARIEPFETYIIKAAANGQIVKALLEMEGKNVKSKEIIKIDSKIDKTEILNLTTQVKNLKENIETNKKILKNLIELTKIKKGIYDRIKNLKTKSLLEKELKKSEYLATYNQMLIEREKILNLENQLLQLNLNIERLKDKLQKKSIKVSGYVYKVFVKEGDFVNFGSPLIEIADTSRGKIVIFLDSEEIENINLKKIYLNGKKTDLDFYKIEKIADTTHISSYRAEIVLKAPKVFSKIVKIEIR